jgi:hypothetical protein
MHRIPNSRELAQASGELSSSQAFADELHCHPPMAMWLNLRQPFRNGPGSDLADDPKQVDVADRDPYEATDLPDPVSGAVDES